MQIIKITDKKLGVEVLQTLNSRDLWKELELKDKYADWIKYQIESLDLEESFDFEVIRKKVNNSKGGRPEDDYIISLDTAKHIAMASRTSKGKEMRKYFIDIEKKYINSEREKFAKLAIEELSSEKVKTLISIDKKQESAAVSIFFYTRKFVEMSDILIDMLKMSNENDESDIYQAYIKTLEKKMQNLKMLNNDIAHITVDFNREISFFKRYADETDVKRYSKTNNYATREFLDSINEKYQ